MSDQSAAAVRRFMLDTNIASYAIKGTPPGVRAHLEAVPMETVVISAVTEAELLYGAAKRGSAELSRLVREFTARARVLAWDSAVAHVYGDLRTSCTRAGIVLGALDMMIAAHAIAADAVLVTADRTFSRVQQLRMEDWVTKT